MPGTGKSTVSQFIHLQLQANNRPSYWCHEEIASHPVLLFYEPERHVSWSEYSEEVVRHWQSYTHGLHGQDHVAVLDAGLLQNHVRSLLIFDCDRNVILDLVGRIERVIASLDPVLIYLKPEDVERNFRDVVEARGRRILDLWIEAHDQYPYTRNAKAAGYAGFLAFWEEFDEISDRVFERLTISKLRENVPTAWGNRYGLTLDFLDLPSPTDAVAPPLLERYTGEYVAAADDHTTSGFFLKAGEGHLVASVDQPTIDVHAGPIGCFREALLMPKGKNRFYVVAWPHEVEFTEDNMGVIREMHVRVSADGWRRAGRVFVKHTGAAVGRANRCSGRPTSRR